MFEENNMEIITPKNSYLDCTDNFGKLERGVVVDSITYIYDLQEENNFKVVTPINKKALPNFAKKRLRNRKT